MPSLYETKARIESIKSTKKITRAMYLISASKSKRAKAQLEKTRPYFHTVALTLADILKSVGNVDSPYINPKGGPGDKKTLCLVLGADKGMAGGYSHNILSLIKEKVDKAGATILAAGMMTRQQALRLGYDVDREFSLPVMAPSVYRAREAAGVIVDRYLNGSYTEVFLIYTRLITPLKQEPVMARLLPLSPSDFDFEGEGDSEVHRYRYEPRPEKMFDHLTPHYLKGVIYSALVEAFTSEQHARMYAMSNANKSADEMIERLTLVYNRIRQAKITQEITEIIGGIPTG